MREKTEEILAHFSAIFTAQLVALVVLVAARTSRAARLVRRTSSRHLYIFTYLYVCKNVAIIIDININSSEEQ